MTVKEGWKSIMLHCILEGGWKSIMLNCILEGGWKSIMFLIILFAQDAFARVVLFKKYALSLIWNSLAKPRSWLKYCFMILCI